MHTPSPTTSYREEIGPFGGKIWRIEDTDLAVKDCGYSLVERFIKENFHPNYDLAIYSSDTGNAVQIICDVKNIPQIVALVYAKEHGTPLTFIGENPVAESYVVGMTLAKGNLDCPGVYKYVDGKLKPIAPDGPVS